MDLLTTIFVTFFAGMGAGLGTGFAGMFWQVPFLPIHMESIRTSILKTV